MLSSLAQGIRHARVTVGLTQEALAARLRLKARSVSRWEIDRSVPKRRHRTALVKIIGEVNQQAGAALAAVFAQDATRRGRYVVLSPAPVAVASPAPIDAKLAFELALFALAEELDVSPGRLRSGLVRWQQRCHEANVTFETAQQQIAAWGQA